jgi:dCMP deaminase
MQDVLQGEECLLVPSSDDHRICDACHGNRRLWDDLRPCYLCQGAGEVRIRPDWDQYFLALLPMIASRSACMKRRVGALIVSGERNLLSTGYNGQPRGVENCPGASCDGMVHRGTPDGRCPTVHAEANAILHAGDRVRLAATLYCTTEPCFECALLIKQTPVTRVVYMDEHHDTRGSEFLRRNGVAAFKLGVTA